LSLQQGRSLAVTWYLALAIFLTTLITYFFDFCKIFLILKKKRVMQVRINSIECRFNQGRHEIVKWQPNHYFNKQQEYLDDGWVLVDGFFKKDNISIQAYIFDKPETCYTVATLHYDADEQCCDLRTVGPRLLDLDATDRNDFFEVYEISEKKIREEETLNTED
jgi:hypothetical protein